MRVLTARIAWPALLLAATLAWSSDVLAQGAAGTPVPAGPPPEQPAREPRASLNVSEDDQVRVEELRVRGESRHITVQPKLPGARAYEILPASGALDPSQRGRRAPGTSQWRVLSF